MPEFNLVCYETLKFDKEPWSLENYLQIGGYSVWQKVLSGELTREAIIEEVKKSGLRGRGGPGRVRVGGEWRERVGIPSPLSFGVLQVTKILSKKIKMK